MKFREFIELAIMYSPSVGPPKLNPSSREDQNSRVRRFPDLFVYQTSGSQARTRPSPRQCRKTWFSKPSVSSIVGPANEPLLRSTISDLVLSVRRQSSEASTPEDELNSDAFGQVLTVWDSGNDFFQETAGSTEQREALTTFLEQSAAHTPQSGYDQTFTLTDSQTRDPYAVKWGEGQDSLI